MKLVTERGLLVCAHQLGHVKNQPSQDLVRVDQGRILVETDPEGRSISGCPNTNPLAGIKPCQQTLKVHEGYSALVRIDGHRVCLDTITGYTDGTPPGTVDYLVSKPGQDLVASSA
jgi:hypothetical protein